MEVAMRKEKGFTLIEILIVVAIIALLSTIVLVGVGTFRSRGRDARRISDLSQVQNGLELYYTKNGTYPDASAWDKLQAALTGSAGLGIVNVPNDPTTGWNYGYCTDATKTKYVLGAYLEDTTNPALKQNTNELSAASPTGIGCAPSTVGTPGSGAKCSSASALTNKFCIGITQQ